MKKYTFSKRHLVFLSKNSVMLSDTVAANEKVSVGFLWFYLFKLTR